MAPAFTNAAASPGDAVGRDVSISVICSVYNGASFLPAYLESLNRQLLANFEVVFIDAASRDGSADLIRAFPFRPGIHARLLTCPSRIGIYAAWNRAIRVSRGGWIMNYNVDDRLFPESLLLLVGAAAHHPEVGVIYSPCFVTRDPSHQRLSKVLDWRDANHIENLVMGCCCGPFPLVRSRCFREHGLFDESFEISGDYEMWCRLSLAGVPFHKLSIPIGSYYVNPAGLSTDPRTQARRVLEDVEVRSRLRRPVQVGSAA